MNIYLKMTKYMEDENYVWYKFESDVPVGVFIDSKGRKINKLETKYGLFRFNKKDNKNLERSLNMIEEQTDVFFLSNPKLKAICLLKMLECLNKNDFCKIIEWAS